MVQNRHNGQPEIQVSGTALAALEKTEKAGETKRPQVHLSLTHERDNAIAVVIIEHAN
jgi:holo-[acyl-carrier protein] synthase